MLRLLDFSEADYQKQVWKSDNGCWMIEQRCNKGYEPFFTLHKKRHFLGFQWWSGQVFWSIEIEKLKAYVERFERFPDFEDKLS